MIALDRPWLIEKDINVIFKSITGIEVTADMSIRSLVNKATLSGASSQTKMGLFPPAEDKNWYF